MHIDVVFMSTLYDLCLKNNRRKYNLMNKYRSQQSIKDQQKYTQKQMYLSQFQHQKLFSLRIFDFPLDYKYLNGLKQIIKVIISMLLLFRTQPFPVQGFFHFNDDQLNSTKSGITKLNGNSLPNLRRNIQENFHKQKVKIKTNERMVNRQSLQSTKEQQYQKSICHNKYTINLVKKETYNSLPKISTLSKAHQALISQEAFEHFKRINSVNGKYQQTLTELQKEESKKLYKLKLPESFKIKTRRNIYGSQENKHRKENQNIFDLPNKQNNQIKTELTILRKTCKESNLSQNKHKTISHIDETKWNLTDFFDPLLSDLSSNKKEAIQTVKLKLSYLNELSRIKKSCQDIQNQLKIKSYVSLFSKFSENVSSKLQRKQKKLDKIQKIFGKTSSIN